MTYSIKKAAVIGSGTMGSGIATLLAGVGVETTLLDIPAKGTQPGDKPAKRNAIVTDNLKKLQSSRPPQLFSANDLEHIHVGNIDDNLDMLSDADWVIEVVVERLDVKQNLMAKLAEVVKPEAIITTNTSGIPIHAIAEGLGHEFTRRFMGTHFFNPPRHLHLLEVIPHPDTDPEVVAFMVEFGTRALGKGRGHLQRSAKLHRQPLHVDHGFAGGQLCAGKWVHCRGGGCADRATDWTTQNRHFPPDRSGWVGYSHGRGAQSVPAIPEDPAREVLKNPKSDAIMDKLMEKGWLGNKSGQGFYKQVQGADGGKRILGVKPRNL